MDEDKIKRAGNIYPQYYADLKAVMATPEGRRFIMNLIEVTCQTEVNDFTNNSLVLSYMEGRRHVGNSLLLSIRNLPDGLDVEYAMRREAAEAERDRPREEQSDIIRNAF